VRGRLATHGALSAGVEPAIASVLDRRLRSHGARPIAVALSGGGDSVALLLAVTVWASRTRRRLLVLTVDHGLRPQSADWSKVCAARCAALGLDFQGLRWVGDKPSAGLPAAAREARHCLLAEAARAAGAHVILMGHTADDVLEAEAMRAAGATTPSPREWAPSPVWPEGRGLFLLRPMLGLRRAEIRAWLTSRGERWIEDPANDDLAYARARARRALAGNKTAGAAAAAVPSIADLARACRGDPAGVLTISRDDLREVSGPAAARFVSVACLCAAGTGRPAATSRALNLAARLRGSEDFAATLAGARVEADRQQVRFLREAGEIGRSGLALLHLSDGAGVWDGRFEIEANRPVEVRAMAGRMAGLSDSERAGLAGFAPRVRPTLPLIVDEAGALPADLRITPLALARLQAASGLVEVEPA
jgi:tRNA(Ile)-lysidine synthase